MRLTLDYDLPDPADFEAGIDSAVVSQALAALVAAFVEAARAEAPYSTRPDRKPGPHLRDRIRAQVDGTTALIEADVPYAIYVLAGVRAQWMTWLLGKTVAFTAKDGTRVVRRVTFVGERNGRRHWWRPASPPNDFFARAWERPAVREAALRLDMLGAPAHLALLYAA